MWDTETRQGCERLRNPQARREDSFTLRPAERYTLKPLSLPLPSLITASSAYCNWVTSSWNDLNGSSRPKQIVALALLPFHGSISGCLCHLLAHYFVLFTAETNCVWWCRDTLQHRTLVQKYFNYFKHCTTDGPGILSSEGWIHYGSIIDTTMHDTLHKIKSRKNATI